MILTLKLIEFYDFTIEIIKNREFCSLLIPDIPYIIYKSILCIDHLLIYRQNLKN